MSLALDWLPICETWVQNLDELSRCEGECWTAVQWLAKCRIDFLQTAKLDRQAQRLAAAGRLHGAPAPIRLALLGSSTLRHLVPSVRVAMMRRGLMVEVYEGAFGQYLQELLEPSAALEEFRPEVIVLALDARHVADLLTDGVEAALAQMERCWTRARERFGATVVQQTVLPVFEDVFGSNEHRLPESPQSQMAEFNAGLRRVADGAGIHLLTIDRYATMGGIDAWHDPSFWHLAKQEVQAAAAPMWGDLLARVVAAQRGRSAKCLVLDLDNTLWGGVVGDDGVDGILLSRGHAAGEAHLAFQRYCLDLKRRGVILAVCSKNDEANALEPFLVRPEMHLRREDLACFVANWNDKAANLRAIAAQLRLGLDALVFADDNPAERALIRGELPEVSVPELPEDPAYFARTIARAGYFEAVILTDEDRCRSTQYAAEARRQCLRQTTTDLRGYLESLKMTMETRSFDEAGLPRIVQLANKTNQFNLTTMRVSEEEVRRLISDPCVLSWQVSLKDRFGDHGVVALLLGRRREGERFEILMWLMSCRVLGRGIEEACLNVAVAELQRRGVRQIEGVYRPTAKNGMVKDLFERMGFALDHAEAAEQHWTLEVEPFVPRETAVTLV